MRRSRVMLAKAVVVFMVFMLIVYAFGLWLNVNTQNLVRQQTIEYTHRQLTYLAENLDREMEHIFRQQVALSNDFALRLLLLYPDTSEMASIFNHLRRINTHFSAIYMSTPHVSGVGVFLPEMNRITRWGLLFSAPTEEDTALMYAIQTNGQRIFSYEQDLVMGMPLLGNLITEPGKDGAVSFVRLSGDTIGNTLSQMAIAYNLTIALYNGSTKVLFGGNELDASWMVLHDSNIFEPRHVVNNGESMWVLRAPFSSWDFELVAWLPNTQVDMAIPTMVATFVLFALSLIVGVICFALYTNRLIKLFHNEKLASEKAQLGQLSLQIAPHFLYNSFYQIYRLGKLGDMDAVSDISLKLSQYFQYITRSREDSITLALEVKHAKDYAAIQNIRYAGQVKCRFDPVPEPYGETIMPKLFLQPIIENAYIHALDNTEGIMLIHVGIAFRNGDLCISVEDNGTTLDDGTLARLQERLTAPDATKDELTSLLNISQRIALMYGEQACMGISRGDMGGLRVEIIVANPALHKEVE